MTMYRWSHDDLEATIQVADRLIANLSYHFQRTYGLLARLQSAMRDDVKLAVDSLTARKLKRDARTLRALAAALDRAANRLTRGNQ